MKIGVIGAGLIGQAFAKHASNAGYEVIISNSRGAETLAEAVKILGCNAKAGSVQEAADSDVIFLAVPWKHLQEAVSAVPSWKDMIVIDPSNPIIMPGFQTAELDGKLSSEVVAAMIPGARIVKAFNTLPAAVLASDPRHAGGRRVIFFSGNDMKAKEIVAEIIDHMGFAGIDLGEISSGGRLQHYPNGTLTSLNLVKYE